jgi:hypothetical protein
LFINNRRLRRYRARSPDFGLTSGQLQFHSTITWNQSCENLCHWPGSSRAKARDETRQCQEAGVDGNRFDELAMALAESGASRRTILGRVVSGSFAAALAAIAITGFAPDEAEAKSCKKKCKKKNSKKKRRKCKKKCKKKDGRCTSNSQCTGTDVCYNGGCVTLCIGGEQCPADTVCVNGVCVDTCANADDCAANEVCSGGGCVATCTQNSDCTGTSICVNNTCEIPTACPGGTECTGGDICVNEICIPAPLTELCDAENPCTGGLVCVANACAVSCATTGDCADGLVCLGDLCVLGDECTSNAQCSGLLPVCLLGRCVASIL